MGKTYILFSNIDDKLSGNDIDILYVGTKKEIRKNVKNGVEILENIKIGNPYQYNESTSFISIFLEEFESKMKYVEIISEGFDLKYYDSISEHKKLKRIDDFDWELSEAPAICVYNIPKQKIVKSYSNIDPEDYTRYCN